MMTARPAAEELAVGRKPSIRPCAGVGSSLYTRPTLLLCKQMFQLLSSTRYDPTLGHIQWNTDANQGKTSPYFLLKYHYDRLLDALSEHNWPIPEDFTISSLELKCDAAVKHTLASLASQDQSLKVS